LSFSILSLQVKRSNLVFGVCSALFVSLLFIGCHGDPLTTPGYREPVLVGGTIQADTTWHAADGPYRVTEDLLVPIGVTWTVEGGTEIFVDWNRIIEIQGRAWFIGDEENRIVVRSEQGVWKGFRFVGGLFAGDGLSYVDIYNAVVAIECVDSVLVGLMGCRIFSNDIIGVRADSGAGILVSSCQFVNDRSLNQLNPTALWASNGGYLTIIDTKISGFHFGVRIHEFPLSLIRRVLPYSFTSRDTITNCDIGIVIDSPQDIIISENVYMGNQTAILITQGNPNISNNDFIKNTDCIHVEGPCAPTAHQNNFIDTGQWAWWNATRDSVDATQNWWGTTDPDSIAALIYDQEDDSLLGLVQFEPFLTNPRP